MKIIRYIELKSGHSDNGPAWIAYVTHSQSGRTLYFNGRGLMKLKGQRRAESGGNYIDMETGESFWVSGVKQNGQDRHWAGSGKVLIEAAAVPAYLEAVKADTLDTSRLVITNSIVETDIGRLSRLANSSRKGWPNDPAPGPYSFVRNVTLAPPRAEPTVQVVASPPANQSFDEGANPQARRNRSRLASDRQDQIPARPPSPGRMPSD